MDMDALKVRRAGRSDEGRLLDMQACSIRALGCAHYKSSEIEGFIGGIGTMDTAMLDDGTYFMAEIGDAIVACGGWSAREPVYAGHVADRSSAGETRLPSIRSVYVNHRFARRGLGRIVVEVVEIDIRARGHEGAALTATLTSVPLYRRLGYRSTSAVTLALANGGRFVAVAMEKRFPADRRLAA